MSDWIPFDIQMEIIKKVSNVKSMLRFRSVSKPWKSYIDSFKFIKGYNAGHTHLDSCTFVNLCCKDVYNRRFIDEAKYICFDDNYETFKVVTSDVISPLVKECSIEEVVGVCQGLVCLYGSNSYLYYKHKLMIVIWNPSIRKSFGIVVPSLEKSSSVFGFGVCPVTSDLTVVKLECTSNYYGSLRSVEVFTLSSGVWTMIPDTNWRRGSIELNKPTSVVIDRFIYWGAWNTTYAARNHVLLSFDLISKEFRVLDLPYSLTNDLYGPYFVSVCKLRESLVVYGCIMGEKALCCGVWVMEHDSSFTKLFTIGVDVIKILGFRKSGEPIFKVKDLGAGTTRINIYDPCSQQIKNLEIDGVVGGKGSLFIESYKESLLLLDHSDLQIYADHIYDDHIWW